MSLCIRLCFLVCYTAQLFLGLHRTDSVSLVLDVNWVSMGSWWLGRGRDEPGAAKLHPRVQQRPRGRSAVGGARQSLGGHRFRPPLGPRRPHVRHPLRLHPVAHPQSPARVPPRPVPGAARFDPTEGIAGSRLPHYLVLEGTSGLFFTATTVSTGTLWLQFWSQNVQCQCF